MLKNIILKTITGAAIAVLVVTSCLTGSAVSITVSSLSLAWLILFSVANMK